MSTVRTSTETTTNRRRGFDTLRLYRGDQPTTGHHLDWLRCSDRLSDADCDDIVSACRAFPVVPATVVDQERYPTRRQADMRKVGVDAGTQWIFDLLCAVASEATQAAYGLDLTTINRAPQYCEYRAGWGQFDWHNDYTHGIAEAPRKLTIIIQLSHPADYEGGQLQMAGLEVEDLPVERGTVVAFPSILFHRVTPVTSGVRKALVAWVAGPRIR